MKNNNSFEQKLDLKGLILFDGYCNLCSRSVRFIIKRDSKDYFRFASLQSNTGKQILIKYNIPESFDKSVIFIEKNSVYYKSEAALRITKKLRHFWPLLYTVIFIPQFLRDSFYNFIAKNRFKWFGKKKECFLPEEDFSYKFL